MVYYVEIGETFIFITMGLASILAVAVFLERWIYFRRSISKESLDLFEQIISFLRKKDLDSALNAVSNSHDNAYKRFIEFISERWKESPEGMEELMDGKILREKLGFETRLPILSTLGNNAPFIGLLGTVLGVIKAFYSLGTLGNTGSEVVMRAISIALLATAAGLGIAIPVVMANNFFVRKTKIILGNLEILAHEFSGNFLDSHKK